ncbi:hypothetical protein Droror1_Dr00007724 [Drosera rotundifolia]
MGKAGKWIRNLLIGKKEKNTTNNQADSVVGDHPTTPVVISSSAPKEKSRWSFRRSSAAAKEAPKELSTTDAGIAGREVVDVVEPEADPKQQGLNTSSVAMAAEQAAGDVQLDGVNVDGKENPIENAAATKIQSVFRSYLARKALRALRGLVKLQALVRGYLVRKQATATLRCMQALVISQARARAQRIMAGKPRQSTLRKSTADKYITSYNEMDEPWEDIKIVEMDLGESKGSSKSRNSNSNHLHNEIMERMFLTHQRAQQRHETEQFSPAPSAMTDMSPRTCSGHLDDYFFSTVQSSPQYHSVVSKFHPSRTPLAFPHIEYAESVSDYPLYPSYMANTESSKAKVRSQSAPKQRPESFERQPSRRRPSVEGRNLPKAVRMQRSTSNVSSAVQNYQYPSSIKLDKSTISLKDSECGSTSSVLTNPIYNRTLVSYDPNRY